MTLGLSTFREWAGACWSSGIVHMLGLRWNLADTRFA